MPLDERSRLTFHAWLVDHDLDHEVASAILGVMPPFDWHEIPKKADIDRRFDDVDRRFSQIGARFEQIDARFSQIDARFDAQTDVLCRRMDEGFRDLRVEMAGMCKEMRTILVALVGFMLSVVLGVMTTGIALAAG
ncbi:MAG: hypothetical protein R6X23_14910 [Acidimicrobiia bacterium]